MLCTISSENDETHCVSVSDSVCCQLLLLNHCTPSRCGVGTWADCRIMAAGKGFGKLLMIHLGTQIIHKHIYLHS